jgi:hypothetical protein
MSKFSTLAHILEGVGRVVDPRIGQAIDAGKAIAHAKSGDERAAAVMAEIEASLALAGDYTGKAALQDPALAALAKKYIEDGIALHAYIEAHKAKQPVASSAAQLGVLHGSTGE